MSTEETLDGLRTEVVLKDEALTSLDRTVGSNVQEIRNLQQENESLKTSLHQLNQDLEALKANLRSKEPINLPGNDEVVLLNQRGASDNCTTQPSSSPSHTTQDQELSKEEKDSALEELKSNGFPWLSESAFYWAAINGKVRPFQIGGYSASFTDSKTKMNYLQAASARGHVEVVKYLLSNRGKYPSQFEKDAKTHEINGLTALQLASEKGHNNVVKELIAAGADVNAPAAGWKGRTALQAAAGGGHIDVIETLIDTGADVNALRATFSAKLDAKLYFTWPEHVREIVKNREYEDRRKGVSALQAAAVGGHTNVAKKLLKEGASTPDAAALTSATRNGDLELVEILLESEGDWTQDLSALESAVKRSHLELLNTLLKSGFPVTKPWLFTLSVQRGNVEILKALIDARLVEGSVSFLGSAALKEAAAREDLQMIDVLLAGRARVCVRDDTPTALDVAIRTGNVTILRRLLTSVSNIDLQRQECSKAYKSALKSATLHPNGAALKSVLENSELGKSKGRRALRMSTSSIP